MLSAFGKSEKMEAQIRELQSKMQEAEDKQTKLIEEVVEKHTQQDQEVDDLKSQVKELSNRIVDLERSTADVSVKPNVEVINNEAPAAEYVEQRRLSRSNAIGLEPSNSGSLKEMKKETIEYVDQMQYTLQESVWDAAMFVGNKKIGCGASVMLIFALIFTIFCKITFSLVILVNMTENDFTTAEALEGLKVWRRNAGHSSTNIDQVTFTSLLSRVCAEDLDMSLEMSTRQQEIVDDIRKYLGSNFMLNGQTLCILSCLLFIMHIVADLSKTINWFRGLYEKRKKGDTDIEVNDGDVNIKSISVRRWCYMTTLCLLRVSITVFICVAGVPFLVQTSNMDDLILNAVSLTFVLDFDDLVFKVFVPRNATRLLRKTQPWLWPQKRLHIRGADFSVVCRLLVAVVIVPSIWSQMINPFALQLHKVEQAVCDPPTNFVYAMNPKMGWIEWSFSAGEEDEDEEKEEVGYNYRTAALQEILSHGNDLHTTSIAFRTEINRVIALSSMDMSNPGVEFGSTCTDQLEANVNYPNQKHHYARVQAILRSALQRNLSKCTELSKSDCDNLFTPEVRALCPQACGCDDSRAGLFLLQPKYGCPNACVGSRHFRENVDTLPCMDPPTEELRVNRAWLRFWGGRAKYLSQSENISKSHDVTFALHKGCGILDFFPHASWCAPLDSALGSSTSLRLWCPQRCGCAGSVDGSCPAQCKNATALVSREQPPDLGDAGACSSISWSGVVTQCTLQFQGMPLFQVPDPMKQECCDAGSRLVGTYFRESRVDNTSAKVICCGKCTPSFFAMATIKMFVEGLGFSEATFCNSIAV
mmetsp:Transcript_81804/g.162339  ORF Transcript_81804/g.162339 Transcript_81804/m.162339 type:complete len:815 (+) Transcript_81804:143-2587(+)